MCISELLTGVVIVRAFDKQQQIMYGLNLPPTALSAGCGRASREAGGRGEAVAGSTRGGGRAARAAALRRSAVVTRPPAPTDCAL